MSWFRAPQVAATNATKFITTCLAEKFLRLSKVSTKSANLSNPCKHTIFYQVQSLFINDSESRN